MLTADARRITQLTQQLEIERRERLRLEATCGGQRAAILRLQAKIATQNADLLLHSVDGADDMAATILKA